LAPPLERWKNRVKITFLGTFGSTFGSTFGKVESNQTIPLFERWKNRVKITFLGTFGSTFGKVEKVEKVEIKLIQKKENIYSTNTYCKRLKI